MPQLRAHLPIGSKLRHRVLVPFPIESPMSGLGLGTAMGGHGRMRYRRSFDVPPDWHWPTRCTVRLHFEAVDWAALVYVNGALAAKHSGGYAPFSVDIDRFLELSAPETTHWLEVQVIDSTDRRHGQPVGKQRTTAEGIWYTPASGIWGTVWLEPLPVAASIAKVNMVYTLPSMSSRMTMNPEPNVARTKQPLPSQPSGASGAIAKLFATIAVRPSWRTPTALRRQLSVKLALHKPTKRSSATGTASAPGSPAGLWPPPSTPLLGISSCSLGPFPSVNQ